MNVGYLSGFISSDILESNVTYKDGTPMKRARFSIGCPRKTKEGIADFIFVTALGKNAENIIKFFSKGKGIYVKYHIQTGSYNDDSGRRVYTEDKIVDEWEFPPVKRNDGSNADNNKQVEIQTDAQIQPQSSDDSFMNIPANIVDSLPFK